MGSKLEKKLKSFQGYAKLTVSCLLYLTRPGLFPNHKREINMRVIKNMRYSWEPHYVTLTGCICFGNTVCHHLVHSILESSCEIIHGHNVVNVGRNKFFPSSNFRVGRVANKLRISPKYQSNGHGNINLIISHTRHL